MGKKVEIYNILFGGVQWMFLYQMMMIIIIILM